MKWVRRAWLLDEQMDYGWGGVENGGKQAKIIMKLKEN